MMKKKVFVGVDTSNYTTSLAILSMEGELIANLKRPLPVKEGECGLRQSDAVFHHTVNFPKLTSAARPILSEYDVAAIGVSTRPRNVEGSYMPCFLVGVSVAESLSLGCGAPIHRFSHQCGHIMATVYSAGREDLLAAPFAAFHISGGTTELVRAELIDGEFKSELIGKTADLNAGQVIDRIGVRLGLAFPAGVELEKLALLNNKKIPKRKVSVNGTSVNLSGLENMAIKLYEQTEDRPLVAAFVLNYISSALRALMSAYRERYGDDPFVFAGGVMSNTIIRKELSQLGDCSFAEPELSRDNAVGIAALARRKHLCI